MQITFHHEGRSYTIAPFATPCSLQSTQVWLKNEKGEGGTFDAEDVTKIIFEALDRYFERKY